MHHQALTFAHEICLAQRTDEIFVSNFGKRIRRNGDFCSADFLAHSMTGRVFHYLTLENDIDGASPNKEWQGRLVELEKVVKKEALKTKQSLVDNIGKQLSVHSERIEKLMAPCLATASLVEKMARQLDEMEGWKKSMEERMSKLETSIDQVQRQNPAGTSAE